MEKLIIRQSRPQGVIEIPAAKNAVLPIIACTILIDTPVILHNITRLTDTYKMLEIIKVLGGKVHFDGSDLIIDCTGINNGNIDKSLTKDIRASIFVLGAVCSRCGYANIGYPGGCNIGNRPIDMHISTLRQMGVEIIEDNDNINCRVNKLVGTKIDLQIPSVGVTENIIMASVKASGTTTITNAAREPEVEALADFVNACGGKVSYDGKGTIVIEGVKELNGCEYTPPGDRIIAGTYLVAGAISCGDVTVSGIKDKYLKTELDMLKDKGCNISIGNDCIRLFSNNRLRASNDISTSPYPGFATDMQAQFMALESVSQGTCNIKENVFDRRLNHAIQLVKMGANITIKGDTATIKGVDQLHGADVLANDLRGGAALVVAAINAKGVTTIRGVNYVDRGYYKIEEDLQKIGVDIVRTNG